jgi:tRNA(Ile)-lysidine synthase
VIDRVRELQDGRPVLVLLSGGRDSVCLLDVAVRISGAVQALHVNYGLRPSAHADEALCRELCERLGVPLHTHRAGAPLGNVQAWAREVRYARALELAAGDVAAGHTASDQVETVLYRLAASPGRRALLGMRAREGRLVRPLLGVSREETTAYCTERGLPWADDPTNESAAYARNRIRHGLAAALREIHPAAEANLLRTLELLRDEADLLDALAERERTDDLERLRAMPPALARLILGPRAPEILALDAGALDLGAGERAVIEHGRVRITRERARAVADVAALTVPGVAAWGTGRVSAEPVGPDAEEAGPGPGVRGVRGPVADGTLDAAALTAPLTVRAWRDGDRMRPLGLGGTKSLQDLFTDRKIARERRRAIPVVLSGEEIAWVPGVATGERFKVTTTTAERVRLRWHP